MQATDTNRSRVPQEGFYFLVPILVGGLLLASAGLKADQLLIDEVTQDGLFGSRWFLIGLVECELLLGMWLLSGTFSVRCRQVVLAVFAVFAIVALQKGLSGESSCGCFGRLEVNPWWTFGLDIFVLGAMWKWTPSQGKLQDSQEPPGETRPSRREGISRRTFAAAGAVLLVGIPISMKMLSAQHATLSHAGTIIGNGQLVILEPEEWIGKPLPIAGHIDIGDQLQEGAWILVLFHHDCPECQEALPRYEELAYQFAQSGDGTRIATIEVPPYGEGSSRANHARMSFYGRLNEKREWFVQAPVEIRIRDGRITEVSRELPSLRASD